MDKTGKSSNDQSNIERSQASPWYINGQKRSLLNFALKKGR